MKAMKVMLLVGLLAGLKIGSVFAMDFIELDAESFQSGIDAMVNGESPGFMGESSAVVLLSYQGCRPCAEMTAVVKLVAEDYVDRVRFYHLDIKAPGADAIVSSLKISAVPTLLFFPRAGERSMSTGSRPLELTRAIFRTALPEE